jgi:DNA-binding protein YbaB
LAKDVDISILNKLIVEAVKRAKKQAQADAKMQAKSNK